MAGAEEHERDGHDRGGAAPDEAVDGGVEVGLGQLDEAAADLEPGGAPATTSAKSQYSATPAAERLPWPTMSSDGGSAWVLLRQADERVDGSGRHRAAALLARRC